VLEENRGSSALDQEHGPGGGSDEDVRREARSEEDRRWSGGMVDEEEAAVGELPSGTEIGRDGV
jgi:hypothetical protein